MWGIGTRHKECVTRFVAALNAHDIDEMSALMTDSFTYIDSLREGVEGREKVLEGLRMLFETDPGFGIEIDRMSYQGGHVLMTGRITSERFGDNRRAVWRVLCDGKHLAEWQSWAEGGLPSMSRALAPEFARNLAHRAAEKPDLSEG